MLQFRPPSRTSPAGLSTEPGGLLRWGMTSRTSRILFIIMITEPGFSTTRSKMGSRSYRNIRQQASTLFFFRNALRFSRHNRDLEHFDRGNRHLCSNRSGLCGGSERHSDRWGMQSDLAYTLSDMCCMLFGNMLGSSVAIVNSDGKVVSIASKSCWTSYNMQPGPHRGKTLVLYIR